MGEKELRYIDEVNSFTIGYDTEDEEEKVSSIVENTNETRCDFFVDENTMRLVVTSLASKRTVRCSVVELRSRWGAGRNWSGSIGGGVHGRQLGLILAARLAGSPDGQSLGV